jgi:hypothetical protein
MSAEAKRKYNDKLKALYPGQTTYIGERCLRGHDGRRYVSGGKCVQCQQERIRADSDKTAAREWHVNNPERSRELNRNWHKNNRQKAVAKTMRRNAAKLRAIPKWADLELIELIYAMCPTGYEVDHIIPLQSKLVCGFHCEQNLRYLKRGPNASKGNRYWPDMP